MVESRAEGGLTTREGRCQTVEAQLVVTGHTEQTKSSSSSAGGVVMRSTCLPFLFLAVVKAEGHMTGLLNRCLRCLSI